MFFEPVHKNNQLTLDDMEPVLAPEDHDQYDLKKIKHPRSREALQVFEERAARNFGYVISDPLED